MFSKLAVVASILSLSFSTLAATSGTLLLQGEVDEVLSITVTPESIASTLPLDVDQLDTKVATVNERSNLAGGYKVKISSENLGNLKRVNGNELFAYELKYDNQEVDLENSETFAFPNAGIVNVNKDVSISYTGVNESSMVAGTYKDIVTFEISPN